MKLRPRSPRDTFMAMMKSLHHSSRNNYEQEASKALFMRWIVSQRGYSKDYLYDARIWRRK